MKSNFSVEKEIWNISPLLAAKVRHEMIKNDLHQDDFDQAVNSYNWLVANLDFVTNDTEKELLDLQVSYILKLQNELRGRGLSKNLLGWCNQALESIHKINGDDVSILLSRSNAYSDLGKWNDAFNDISSVIKKSSDKEIQLFSTFLLGRLKRNQGDYINAYKNITEASTLKLNEKYTAEVNLEIANYYLDRRKFDLSIKFLLEAKSAAENNKNIGILNQVKLILGIIYRKKSNYDRALSYLIDIHEDKNFVNRALYATAIHHLSWVYLNQGKLFESKNFCLKSIDIYKDINNIRGLSDSYEQLGMIFLSEKNILESENYLLKSLNIRQEIGNKHGEASSLRHLGMLCINKGDFYKAIKYLFFSLKLYRSISILDYKRFFKILYEMFDWIFGKKNWTI